MQVNVKELTGVLHLSLVFMIVLVLQSFLAVSFQVSQVSLVYSSVLCQAFQAPSVFFTSRVLSVTPLLNCLF